MINQITQVISLLSTFPNRNLYVSSKLYAQAVSSWLSEQKDIYPQLNTLFSQINVMINEMNTDAVLINAVYDIVLANVNYKGDFVSGTNYMTGESVTHIGVDYLSKIDNNTDTPPSVNWKEVPKAIDASTVYTKTESDAIFATKSESYKPMFEKSLFGGL